MIQGKVFDSKNFLKANSNAVQGIYLKVFLFAHWSNTP
jgi:hypothetical protein